MTSWIIAAITGTANAMPWKRIVMYSVIISSEKMIAMIAARAICRPKLDDTFLVLGVFAFAFACSSSVSLFWSVLFSFFSWIWKLL